MTLLAIESQGCLPFAERISPTFNLTLLLLQALDVALQSFSLSKID